MPPATALPCSRVTSLNPPHSVRCKLCVGVQVHVQTHTHVLFPACPALLPAAHPAPELLHAGAGAASSGSGYCYIALETN